MKQYANREMETRDADLGYILRYAQALHTFIINGGVVTPCASKKIRESLEAIREALVSGSIYKENAT